MAGFRDLCDRGVDVESALIAVRDDDLCLVNTTFSIDDELVERLVVVETRDGLIVRTDWFDHTDFGAAIDQLDQRWLDLGGPNAEIRLAIAFREAQHAGDVRAARQVLSDDFVLTDHSMLGVGQLGLDEHLATSIAGAGGVVAVPVEYLDYTDTAALARIRFGAPDGSAWEYWVITRTDGDRTRSVDLFAIDDLDEARATFAALSATVDVARSGSEPPEDGDLALGVLAFYDGLVDRWKDPDPPPDQILRLLAEDFVYERRQLEVEAMGTGLEARDRDGFVDLLYWLKNAGGMNAIDNEVVAVRGDPLALVRVLERYGDDEIVVYHVSEIRDGRFSRIVEFGESQLADALDELDRRWIELGGPTALVAMLQGIRHALDRGDAAELRGLISDELTSTDHRRLGMGTRDADEWISSLSAGGASELVVHEILAHSDRLLLARSSMCIRTEDTLWNTIGIFEVDAEGRAARWELFDVNAIGAAFDRYHELVAEERPPDPRRSNRATRVNELLVRASTGGDRERFLALLTDDFASVSHEQLRIDDDQLPDREVFTQQIFDTLGLAKDVLVDSMVVAIRGDDLCLVRIDTRFEEGNIASYVVEEVVGDRMCATEWFDVDDLMTALDVLDLRWAERGGPARVLEHTIGLRRAIHDGDVGAARAVLSPAFRAADHRRLGLPVLDRDGYLAAPKGGSGTQLFAVDVVRHADDASLERIEVNLEDGWSTMEMWAVISLDAHGIATMDNYDVDDLDAARARFDELTASCTA